MVICVILEIKIPINKSPCSPSGIANKLGLVLHYTTGRDAAAAVAGLRRSPVVHFARFVFSSKPGSCWLFAAASSAGLADQQQRMNSTFKPQSWRLLCRSAAVEKRPEKCPFLGKHTRFTPTAQRWIINSSLNRNCYSINLCFHIFIVHFIVAYVWPVLNLDFPCSSGTESPSRRRGPYSLVAWLGEIFCREVNRRGVNKIL